MFVDHKSMLTGMISSAGIYTIDAIFHRGVRGGHMECDVETIAIPAEELFHDLPIRGQDYKFEKVADGVYYATSGSGSNNVVIVNEQDVPLADDGTTPAATRAFLDDITKLGSAITPPPENLSWVAEESSPSAGRACLCFRAV